MAGSDDVVIIAGCRTPIGKFQGSLSDLTAPQLGAIAVREAVKRAFEEGRLGRGASTLILSCRTRNRRTKPGRARRSKLPRRTACPTRPSKWC